MVSFSIDEGGRGATQADLADRRDKTQKDSTDVFILHKGGKGNCNLTNMLPMRHEVDWLEHHKFMKNNIITIVRNFRLVNT